MIPVPRAQRAFAISVLLPLLAASGSALGQVSVTMKRRALCGGRLVRLGDAAHVKGGEGALRRKISGVLLGVAPRPGDVRTITRNYVKARLFQEGIDVGRITFCGATTVVLLPSPEAGRLSGRPAVVSGGDIVSAIRLFAAEELGRREPDIDVELISFRWIDGPPKGADFSFAVAGSPGGRIPGRGRYTLEAQDEGLPVGRAVVWAEVVEYRDALALRRKVEPLERLAAGDLVLARIPVSRPGAEFYSDPAELSGSVVLRPLQPGDPVTRDCVRKPPLVERGQIVTVVLEAPGCRIADQARACGAGSHGEVITVENLRSRKTFRARVVGESLVAAVP